MASHLVPAGPLPGSQQLFQRIARVTVGLPVPAGTKANQQNALVVEGLHVQAKTHKSCRLEPSTCEISIFNLNAAHRAQIKARGLPVLLEAGYTNTIGQIYSGVTRFVDHVRTGADWITKIQLGSGESAYRFARLNQSWGAGISVRAVATALVNTLGTQASGTAGVLATIPGTFPRGYALNGMASKALDALLYGRGYEWHLQGGQVVVLPQGGATSETAVLLNRSTGLVGSPEHGTSDPSKPFDSNHTLKVKALLQPTIKPGGLIQIQAEGIGATSPAFFRAYSVDDEIDTQGENTPFYTDIEAWPAGTI